MLQFSPRPDWNDVTALPPAYAREANEVIHLPNSSSGINISSNAQKCDEIYQLCVWLHFRTLSTLSVVKCKAPVYVMATRGRADARQRQIRLANWRNGDADGPKYTHTAHFFDIFGVNDKIKADVATTKQCPFKCSTMKIMIWSGTFVSI